MSLVTFFTVSLASFALLQFQLLPRFEAGWAENSTLDKFKKISVLAALTSARSIFQMALIVYGALLLCFWLSGWLADTDTAAGYLNLIGWLEKLEAKISFIQSSILANIALWVALLGLALSCIGHALTTLWSCFAC